MTSRPKALPDTSNTFAPNPRPGEPIRLASGAPVALWFDEPDGGWLQLDPRITRDLTTLTLQIFWEENGARAFWVLGFGLRLCELAVGKA